MMINNSATMAMEINKSENAERAQDKMTFPSSEMATRMELSTTELHTYVRQLIFRILSNNNTFNCLQTLMSDTTHVQAKEIIKDEMILLTYEEEEHRDR